MSLNTLGFFFKSPPSTINLVEVWSLKVNLTFLEAFDVVVVVVNVVVDVILVVAVVVVINVVFVALLVVVDPIVSSCGK